MSYKIKVVVGYVIKWHCNGALRSKLDGDYLSYYEPLRYAHWTSDKDNALFFLDKKEAMEALRFWGKTKADRRLNPMYYPKLMKRSLVFRPVMAEITR